MWLDDRRLQTIDAVLQPGRASDVDELLSEILHDDGRAPARTVCATCRRDLVRRPLPRPDLYVSACPEGHGAWMTGDVLEALRTFVETETGRIARKRHTIAVLNRAVVLGAFALVAALAISYAVAHRLVPLPKGPIATSTTLSREEWIYFQQVMHLLDEGTSNRLALEADLGGTPATYRDRLDVYRRRQGDLRERLVRLETPARARPVHDKILLATDQQIRFYEAFVEAKVADPAVDLRRMAEHPDARGTDQSLWAAWHLIVETYPSLDGPTSRTIEQHLCAYDVRGNL